MEAVRYQSVVGEDGEVVVSGLPSPVGRPLEIIVLGGAPRERERPVLTARQLMDSGVISMWKGRTDIEESATYGRRLREEAQRRRGRW